MVMVQGAERGAGAAATAAATDMWGVIGRELWKPWPQADVVVHTGSQVTIREREPWRRDNRVQRLEMPRTLRIRV